MEKNNINNIYSDVKKLLILFIIVSLIFKLVFYKESIYSVIRVSSSLFWLFVMPGFLLVYTFNISFIEKIVAGAAVGFGIVGVLSYYLGLAGLDVRYHIFIIPTLIILTGVLLFIKKK